jgi:hypothetical protein
MNKYIAINEEFNAANKIIATVVVDRVVNRDNFENCLAWCKLANKNGFNYVPVALIIEDRGDNETTM